MNVDDKLTILMSNSPFWFYIELNWIEQFIQGHWLLPVSTCKLILYDNVIYSLFFLIFKAKEQKKKLIKVNLHW